MCEDNWHDISMLVSNNILSVVFSAIYIIICGTAYVALNPPLTLDPIELDLLQLFESDQRHPYLVLHHLKILILWGCIHRCMHRFIAYVRILLVVIPRHQCSFMSQHSDCGSTDHWWRTV